MRKTYRYRLYPTKTQILFLDSQLTEACSLYNAALEERRISWKMAHRSINFYEQCAQLKDIRADGNLAIVNFMCSCDVLRRVDKTFQAFFRRVKNREKAGYPRFKSRNRYNSITFPSYGNGCRLLDSGKLRIQGAGVIKVKLHRPIDGKIKTVTIKREAGRWYVSFSVECEANPLPALTNAVGIDVGLTSFAVLSDGSVVQNPRYYKHGQSKLRIAQRKVARRKKGSSNRKKAVQILQRTHERIKNQRADYQHKASRSIVNQYGLIAVEDLNIKGLATGILAKSVNDASWGMFLDKLSYKAEDAGRQFVRVNPNGTTQNCSACGIIVPKTLSERWHLCPSCGLSLSRDENAARNILNLGLGSSLWASTWNSGSCVAQEAVQRELYGCSPSGV